MREINQNNNKSASQSDHNCFFNMPMHGYFENDEAAIIKLALTVFSGIEMFNEKREVREKAFCASLMKLVVHRAIIENSNFPVGQRKQGLAFFFKHERQIQVLIDSLLYLSKCEVYKQDKRETAKEMALTIKSHLENSIKPLPKILTRTFNQSALIEFASCKAITDALSKFLEDVNTVTVKHMIINNHPYMERADIQAIITANLPNLA